MAQQRLPRGLRNNNPLNLRKSDNKWQGKVYPGTDNAFEQFVNVLYGIRAAMVCMNTHIQRDHKARIRTTIKREITRWAPPSENNVQAYINAVCVEHDLTPDTIIDPSNKNVFCRILWHMAFHENGVEVPFNYFERAYDLWKK